MLLNWEWGVKETLQEEYMVKYLTSRKTSRKEICELKFDIIQNLLQNEAMKNMMTPAVLLQLKAYHAGGVYGEKMKPDQTPEYATKNY